MKKRGKKYNLASTSIPYHINMSVTLNLHCAVYQVHTVKDFIMSIRFILLFYVSKIILHFTYFQPNNHVLYLHCSNTVTYCEYKACLTVSLFLWMREGGCQRKCRSLHFLGHKWPASGEHRLRLVFHNSWTECTEMFRDPLKEAFTCSFSFIMSLSCPMDKIVTSSGWCDTVKSDKQLKENQVWPIIMENNLYHGIIWWSFYHKYLEIQHSLLIE